MMKPGEITTPLVTKPAAPAAGQLVRPSEPTPSHILLLSSIDTLPPFRYYTDTLHVFMHGREPAKVIRRAISRALVFYYPLAGRLVHSGDDDLRIACTGDGVYFVEAQAKCKLEDVNFLQRPLMIPIDDLLPYLPHPQEPAPPLFMIQVTEFKCGGFAVGTRYNHMITDGVGLGQILQAVGEMARGLTRPTIDPIWQRDVIPIPTKTPQHHSQVSPPPFTRLNFNLEDTILDIPQDHIDHLINQVTKETGIKCTTFDVLAAKLWQSRTRAINFDPQVPVIFSFTANIRPLLHALKQGGYYGNCVYMPYVTVSSERVKRAPISELVSLIQDKKENLRVEFMKWTKGELEQDPYEVRNTYALMHVTDWRNVGFSDVDFGWGSEMHSGVGTMIDYVVIGFLTRPPASSSGARVTARFVMKEHLAAFHDEMMSF
ncbi:myricetin 3-O-glucosyl 1,2-rhamnoside 6'-O-caffeoyltransferase AT2-like [Dioscorea cayenensis subsp. rotundata]|uniref:Myricetin 3-O-glucosyl 1,2-rhamnoside 6'-O-caffeoyltransferase AT2-like n=1 Tax=Dioscorea cayennensis subsp. rotundata TaxID=55577 RepID=A0AB40AR68_DIOCR|nr:myricetin 3-O-glucosyl 1,2-rhamnoside 6'-O-caffeoyltransferase AT2-like [Dioscorea cayenensis subsp. rotundata]